MVAIMAKITRKSTVKKPPLTVQTTTLWDYPSQHYGEEMQGHQDYRGATPSYVIWNMIQRYTKPQAVVLDPMCGSGTTLDVCVDTGRRGLGFDLQPTRPEITFADARHLPVGDASVDMVFVDPPYSTHLSYSGRPECIGELDAADGSYYEGMAEVLTELYRVLKPGGVLGVYVSDSFKKGKPFMPIGFELFAMMREKFEALDIVCVTRHNRTLKRNHWHTSAVEGNYYLRGFNYLFIMQKPVPKKVVAPAPENAPPKKKKKKKRVGF